MEPDSNPSDAQRRVALSTHLAEHRARYLAFVRGRVESTEVAEDLLQDVVTRALQHAESLRGPVEPWLFRMLRNAIVDHMRRRGASARALEAFEQEVLHTSLDPNETPNPCPCVRRLQQQLKVQYADALEQVAIIGVPLKEFADRRGISVNNAGVRVFRAREALRKNVNEICGACAATGCTNCSCVS